MLGASVAFLMLGNEDRGNRIVGSVASATVSAILLACLVWGWRKERSKRH